MENCHAPCLPIELISKCLQYTHDPHLQLYLESISHEIRAAHLPLPGRCETTVGSNWSHDINRINRLAALHHKLDRVHHLAIHVDSLPEQFFQHDRCKQLESLELIDVQSVPACVADLDNLHDLKLVGTFVSLPKAIGKCRALQNLSIISAMPGWITEFRLPDTLGSLINLHTLYLQIDSLITWPDSASALTALSSLTLHCQYNMSEYCHQRRLPHLPALRELHLLSDELEDLEVDQLLNPTLQLLHIRCFERAACCGLPVLLHIGAQRAAQAITDLAQRLDSSPASLKQLQQLLQQELQLSGLKSLRLEGSRTGLLDYAAAEALAAERPIQWAQRLAEKQRAGKLHPLCLQHPLIAWLLDTTNLTSEYHFEVQLAALFRSCLTAVTSLEVAVKGGEPSSRGTWNASQPLYEALSALPQLQQLKLSGLQEMPAGSSSSNSCFTEVNGGGVSNSLMLSNSRGMPLKSSSGGSCGDCSSSSGVFASLTQLKVLDLQDCGAGSSNDDTATATAGSSSCGSHALQLPASLTCMRFVRCGALPVQQLLDEGHAALQQLIIDKVTAAQAGDSLQLLAARGCKLQVEE